MGKSRRWRYIGAKAVLKLTQHYLVKVVDSPMLPGFCCVVAKLFLALILLKFCLGSVSQGVIALLQLAQKQIVT